jgi:hypothetical protein
VADRNTGWLASPLDPTRVATAGQVFGGVPPPTIDDFRARRAPVQVAGRLSYRQRVDSTPEQRLRLQDRNGPLYDTLWKAVQAVSRVVLTSLEIGENRLPEPHGDPESSHAQYRSFHVFKDALRRSSGKFDDVAIGKGYGTGLTSYWKKPGQIHLRPETQSNTGTYHISEDRQALRSSVLSGPQAYWAIFEEFGDANGRKGHGEFAKAVHKGRAEMARQAAHQSGAIAAVLSNKILETFRVQR